MDNIKSNIEIEGSKLRRTNGSTIKSCEEFFKIQSRRYLGSKYKLKNFISETIRSECGNFDVFADLFAGTGIVSSFFCDKTLIINDILYSNYISYHTWYGKEEISFKKIEDFIYKYNSIKSVTDNYMSINFADTYFSIENCRKIGYIREDIENEYKKNNLNYRERCILITSLLYGMDKIANTCGHYDSYRKNIVNNSKLILHIPNLDYECKSSYIYNMDINELVKEIEADVVYLDPPYNSRQYSDLYHLLENVAWWGKPEVYGVARKMDRTCLKSNYCTTRSVSVFKDLIDNLNTGYIVLSYNNMAQKGNLRSNAKMSDDDIYSILSSKGKVKVFEYKHKAFTAGKSNIEDNKERLFICKC